MNAPFEPNTFYELKDLKERLGIKTRDALRGFLKRYDVPKYRIGLRWFVKGKDILNFADKKTN